MSTLELLAVIFAVLVLVKLVVVLINPQAWMNKVTAPIYGNPTLSTIVFVILAAIVGYYLLPLVSIIEIGAIALFISLLMGIGMLPYSKLVMGMRDDVVKMGIGRAWLSTIIWAAAAIWILYTVYF